MTTALTVVAIMVAKAGQEPALKQLLTSALPRFQAEPGCQAYTLLTDLEKPARFVTYETWDDEAALQGHMKAPTMTEAAPLMKDLLAEPMQQFRLNALPGSTTV